VISELTVSQASAVLLPLAHDCYRGLLSEGKASAIAFPSSPVGCDREGHSRQEVIARVTAAKKIFVSNAGVDKSFTQLIPGGPNGTYSELYASLRQWGYFQLVDSPSQADLIFEIRSSVNIRDYLKPGGNVNIASDKIESYIPIFTLSIFEASTHDPVSSIVVPAGRGSNKAKGAIAFTQSIGVLTDKIKALVSVPAATQNP
jgi:hypothetical protein